MNLEDHVSNSRMSELARGMSKGGFLHWVSLSLCKHSSLASCFWLGSCSTLLYSESRKRWKQRQFSEFMSHTDGLAYVYSLSINAQTEQQHGSGCTHSLLLFLSLHESIQERVYTSPTRGNEFIVFAIMISFDRKNRACQYLTTYFIPHSKSRMEMKLQAWAPLAIPVLKWMHWRRRDENKLAV